MTPPGADPRVPRVTVQPRIACAAGSAVDVVATVRHDGDRPARITVTVLGLDGRWTGEPVVLPLVAPGEDVEVTLTLTPERGAVGAHYPFVVAAEAVPLGTSAALLGIAESTLLVDGRERLSLTVEPATASAVAGRRIRVRVTNPGRSDREVTLSAQSGHGIVVGLDEDTVLAPAGRTVTVAGRIRVRRPRLLMTGGAHSFAVTARSSGAPEHAQGTLRAVPLLRGALVKSVSLVLVVALWAAAAVLLIPKLTDAFSGRTEVTQAAPGGPGATSGGAQRGTASGGAPTSGRASTGAPGQGGTGGGDGSSGGAPTSGAPGSGTGSGPGTGTASDPKPVSAGAQLLGSVSGPAVGGVTAELQPTSLVQAAASGATGADPGTAQALRAPEDGPLGKIPAEAVQPLSPLQSAPEGTRTGSDGSFAFGGIATPGYYLLTLSKPGLQTQRFIVDSTQLAGADPLQVAMVAGTGSLQGTVTGPDGPVGAATVTVTDGTVSLSTSTRSGGSGAGGAAGAWSAEGLSTPGTYLVTVASPGLGTTSSLVTLPAGGSATTDLTMQRGTAAVTGLVQGTDTLGRLGGLGGITVSLSDGTTTRTATTVTTGPVGRYVLAGIPSPGSYTMTVTGTGFQPQTRTVTVGRGVGQVTADVSLTGDSGVVTGRALDETGAGLAGVGLTLTGDQVSYKTMSTSSPAGRYRFSGVQPGTYLLTAAQFGRATASTIVTVTAPQTTEKDVTLRQDADLELVSTSRIRGRVIDASTDGALTCTRVAVAGAPCRVTVSVPVPVDPSTTGGALRTISSSAGPEEDWTLPGLDDTRDTGLVPGLYTVSISAPGYEPATVQVQVSQGMVTLAPQVSLQPLGRLSGTVTPRTGQPASPSCVVAAPAGTALPSSCTVDGTACTTPGPAAARCAVVATDGSYEIVGLTHGSYQVAVLTTDPEYLDLPAATVQLGLGADAAFSATLDRYGRATVTVLTPDVTTLALAPRAGLPVTLTPLDGATRPVAPTVTTSATGQAAFAGLSGRYRVTAGSATSTLTIALNQTQQPSLVVTTPLGPVVGRITTSVDGEIVPVPGAAVTFGGVVGFAGQTAVRGTATVTTDAQGCWAVVPAGWRGGLPLTSTDCPVAVAPASSGTLVDAAGRPASLVALPATVAVARNGTTTQEFATTAVLVSATGAVRTVPVTQVTAQPSPVGLQTLRRAPDDSGGQLVDATITVTAQPAGAGAVTVRAQNDGTLQVTDPALGAAGVLVPGRYSLHAELADFVPATADLLCELGGECRMVAPGTSTDAALTLRRLPTLTASVLLPTPTAAGTTVDQLAGKITARVTALSATGAGTLTLTLGSVGTTDVALPGGGTAREISWTYRDTSRGATGLAVPGTYQVSFDLDGYTGAAVTVTCGADFAAGCTPVRPVLKSFPTVGASARITMVPAGAPVPLDAAVVVTSKPNGSGPITVSVGANGVLGWQEAGLPAGVVRPGEYQLQVTGDGADQSAGAAFSCAATDTDCSPQLVLTQRTDLQLSFVAPGGASVGDVRAVLTGSTLTAPATAVTLPGGNQVTYRGMVALPGTSYGLRVQAGGYAFQDLTAASSSISCTNPNDNLGSTRLQARPGGTTSCTVTLQPLGRLRVLTQEVITPPTGPSTTPVLGAVALSVQRFVLDGRGDEVDQGAPFAATSGDDGTVTVTGTNTAEGLIAGSYRITATRAGHQDASAEVTLTESGGSWSVIGVVGATVVNTSEGQQLVIGLPVQTRTVQLNLASVWDIGTPLLQPLTARLIGPNGSYTCSYPATTGDPCTITEESPTDPGASTPPKKFLQLTGVNPGSYQLSIDPPNPSNPAFYPFSQRVDIPVADQANSVVDFSVYLYVRSNSLTVHFSDGTTPFTRSTTVELLTQTSSGLEVAKDWNNGTLSTSGIVSGTATFNQVPDGSYYVRITSAGYDVLTSDRLDLVKFLTPVQPDRTFTLSRSARSVTLTVQSSATAPGGGAVAQAGTTLLLTQTDATGSLPLQDPNGPLTVSGSDPATASSSGALSTGSWSVATVAQAGLTPVAPATALPSVFTAGGGSFDVAAGSAPQQTTVVLQQRVLQMTLTFTPTACTQQAPLPAQLPFTITRSGGGVAQVTATVDAAAGTVTASATLPAGQYTFAPVLTGIAGWSAGPAAAAATLSVPAGSAAGSLAPVTATSTLVPSTGPVAPTFAVDGTAQSGTSVSATAGTTTRTLTTGQTACLAPGAWSFALGSATGPVLGQTATGTVTTGAALPVPFAGYTLTPTVALQAVTGRPADAVDRTYSVSVRKSGTQVWQGDVTIPAGQTTAAATTLTVPAGSYTVVATLTTPTSDVFASTATSAAVDPSAAAGTETPTATLAYQRAGVVLTPQYSDASAHTGTTVTLVPATGAPVPLTLTGAGPYWLGDLTAGTYDLWAQTAEGNSTYLGEVAAQTLGAGTSTPVTVSLAPTDTATVVLTTTGGAATAAQATLVPSSATGAVTTIPLSGTGSDTLTDIAPGAGTLWVQSGTGSGTRLGSTALTAVVGLQFVSVTASATTGATVLVRPGVTGATVQTLLSDGTDTSTTPTGGTATLSLGTSSTYHLLVGKVGAGSAAVTGQTFAAGLTVLTPTLDATSARVVLDPTGPPGTPTYTVTAKAGTTAVTDDTTTALAGGWLLWTRPAGPTGSYTWTVTTKVSGKDWSGEKTATLTATTAPLVVTLTQVTPAGG